MNVKLIYYTGAGRPDEQTFAACLLKFTKSTRLEMTPQAFDVFVKSHPRRIIYDPDLEYMASTIASSWEFVDLIFAITDVSRACAQQITRTRTASYAMQSQRVTDMSKVSCHIPDTIRPEHDTHYKLALGASLASYADLVKKGVSLEDARGVLPMNTHCNLIAKYNLRAWVDLVRSRNSMRVQGEYQDVIHQMREEVTKVWPWVKSFLEPKQQKSIALVEEVAMALPKGELRTRLAKAADLLKKETS